MKKATILVVVLVIIVFGGYLYYDYSKTGGIKSPIIGGDKDAGGCLVGAGYSWCEAKDKCLRVFEEFCPNSLSDLVKDIKDNTGVILGVGPEELVFDWMSKDRQNDKKIEGYKFSSLAVNYKDVIKVEQYMNNRFEIDNYNVAGGPGANLTGYVGQYMACILYSEAQMMESSEGPLVPVNDDRTVSLTCGFFNKNLQAD